MVVPDLLYKRCSCPKVVRFVGETV